MVASAAAASRKGDRGRAAYMAAWWAWRCRSCMAGQGQGRTGAGQLTWQPGGLGAAGLAWQQLGRYTAASGGPALPAALPTPLPSAQHTCQGSLLFSQHGARAMKMICGQYKAHTACEHAAHCHEMQAAV